MRHTLVAAFATLTDANRTRGDLMSRGIAREQIHAIGAESADIHAYDAPYTTTPDVPQQQPPRADIAPERAPTPSPPTVPVNVPA